MDQLIRTLSPRAEFVIVALIAFGYFILGNVFIVLDPGSHKDISETGLKGLFVHELIVITLLGVFLRIRGWSFEKLGFQPGVKETVGGIALAVITYVTFAAIWMAITSIAPELLRLNDKPVISDLSLATALAISVLNPVFEEIFVCGYIISALSNTRGVSDAVNVSVGIRLAYHLYQGPIGVINIVPTGLIFAYSFARTGRLWPLVTAHAVLDLASLWPHIAT